MPLQKLIFTRGMDSDTSPQAFSEGVGRFRIDCRIANPNSENKESAENVLGNELVSYTLPVGTNKVGPKPLALDKPACATKE